MSTTPTTRVTQLHRRYRVDVDIATYPASNYQQLYSIMELKLIQELRTESDEHYEDAGANREMVTGYSWRLEGKIDFSTNTAGTAADPIHLFLRQKFNEAMLGSLPDAEFGIRWYDRDGLDADDSFEGRAYVKAWPHDGGSSGAKDSVSFVVSGQGALALIANPEASALPAVYSVSPTGGAAAGDTPVNIYGTHFTGVTDVDFGADAAVYMFVNDGHIVAFSPAHAAGSVQVKVTNAAGASPNTTADDYLYA